MRVYGLIIGAALMVLGMLGGCSADKSSEGDNQTMQFDAEIAWPEDSTLNDEAKSRVGQFVDGKLSFTPGDLVGVLAFNTPRSWTQDKATVFPTYSYNNKLTYLSRSFSCETIINYPHDGSKVSILAYYPYVSNPNDQSAVLYLGNKGSWPGSQQPIYYRVDPDQDKHVDLMVAFARDLSLPPLDQITYVRLNFEHMLSNVKFSAKLSNQIVVNMGYTATINSVTISGPLSPSIKGYILYDPDKPFNWSYQLQGEATLVSTPSSVTSITKTPISSTMQIPQMLYDQTYIKVKYTLYKSGAKVNDFEVSYHRSGDNWPRNKVFNYVLTINPETNDVSISSGIEAWKTGNEISGVI